MATFHDPVLLYNNTLSFTRNNTIINCLPISIHQSFFHFLQEFTEQKPQNRIAPDIFDFISEDLSKVAKTYSNYPLEKEEVIPSTKVDVKHVQTQQNNFNSRNLKNSLHHRPCSSCSFKGYDDQHYPLGRAFGIIKLSSKEILCIMGRVNACFTCGLQHASDTGCKHTCTNSVPNACPKGCLHNKVPVNPAVCKHSNESPSITVSKVGSDKAIPMMDILTIKSIPLDVQYDTGCQLSLITTSALILLPQTSYSLGNSNMINLLAYNGISELLPATEVKLNLGNRVIKLIAVYSNLNCGSAYSFPTPHKWRKYTKYNVTSHSGKVAILFGGDNYHCHSSHVKEDERGVILLRSKLSGRHIIFAPVNPSSITWSQSKNNINLVNASLPTPLWTQSTTRYLSSIYTTRRSCPN